MLKIKQLAPLTQSVSVGGYGWHGTPGSLSGVEALDRVECFQSISATDHVQLVIKDSDTKLQPSRRHVAHRFPFVETGVVPLDTDGTCVVCNREGLFL